MVPRTRKPASGRVYYQTKAKGHGFRVRKITCCSGRRGGPCGLFRCRVAVQPNKGEKITPSPTGLNREGMYVCWI